MALTKADVISYYVDVAPMMLPHLRDRPVTLRRFPGGVGRPWFFQKHVPRGAPAWVRTFRVPRSGQPGSEDIVAMVVCDPATLVWAANLAALELHVPMWRRSRPGRYGLVDLMVFDLDPGPSTSIVECCQVAQWLRHLLEPGGLVPLPKTSGSKGLQLYVPLRPGRPWELVRTQARDIARQVGTGTPISWSPPWQRSTGRPRCSSIGARTIRPRPPWPPTRCGHSPGRPCPRR